MPGIYGGDDISAIVLDAGSSSTRAGWAGEDTPRVVIPSSYGWLPGDVELEAAQTSNGHANGRDAMEGVETNGNTESAATDDRAPTTKKAMSDWEQQKRRAENRRRFLGDGGVNSWRKGMEIGNPFEDDVCEYASKSQEI
jgi:actin-related protein 4